jgi:NAD(P)-dependent dehydrogenase (short-subunit alcohol dehydrogenase family)
VVARNFALGHADLGSFGSDINAVVVGATGGIGNAFVEALLGCGTVARVLALSRSDPRLDTNRATWIPIDIEDEDSIQAAAEEIRSFVGELHLVVVASGVLHHGQSLQPEKTWRALNADSLEMVFRINTVGPILVAKHLLPLLAKNRKSALAALSARVGSISDNRLGGWHSYRASKAALNMLLKTLSIELMRVNPNALCIALHPGTVDSRLSKPFQANVSKGKLFSPQRAASQLLTVIDGLVPEQSGKMLAWDGTEIPF